MSVFQYLPRISVAVARSVFQYVVERSQLIFRALRRKIAGARNFNHERSELLRMLCERVVNVYINVSSMNSEKSKLCVIVLVTLIHGFFWKKQYATVVIFANCLFF